MARGAEGGGVGVDRVPTRPLGRVRRAGEADSEVRAGSRAARSEPRLPRAPYPSCLSPPARGLQTPPLAAFKSQGGQNSPKSGAELDQGRPDTPGPWPRLGGEGLRRGVAGSAS